MTTASSSAYDELLKFTRGPVLCQSRARSRDFRLHFPTIVVTRTQLSLLLIVVTLAPAVAGAGQQQLPDRMTVERARIAIDKAARDRKIKLDPAAINTLALEVVRQETAAPGRRLDATETKVDAVLVPFADRAAATEISATEAQKSVNAAKAKQVVENLDKTIDAHAIQRRALPPDVRLLVKADLQRQAEGLAGSGLPPEIIQERMTQYLTALDQTITVAGGTLSKQDFMVAHDLLFGRLVNVSIDTEPAGAAVTLDGADIGNTSIKAKPFEPGKSYAIGFSFPGYQAVSRTLYVSVAPELQNFREVLMPAGTAGPGAELPAPAKSFPYLIVILAGTGLLALIAVLVRMKA